MRSSLMGLNVLILMFKIISTLHNTYLIAFQFAKVFHSFNRTPSLVRLNLCCMDSFSLLLGIVSSETLGSVFVDNISTDSRFGARQNMQPAVSRNSQDSPLDLLTCASALGACAMYTWEGVRLRMRCGA